VLSSRHGGPDPAVFRERKGVIMPLMNVVNTEMALTNPIDNSLDTAFGRTALKLLEKGDRKKLDKLMELYKQAKSISGQLEKLEKSK
jgi:hypothetical protein